MLVVDQEPIAKLILVLEAFLRKPESATQCLTIKLPAAFRTAEQRENVLLPLIELHISTHDTLTAFACESGEIYFLGRSLPAQEVERLSADIGRWIGNPVSDLWCTFSPLATQAEFLHRVLVHQMKLSPNAFKEAGHAHH